MLISLEPSVRDEELVEDDEQDGADDRAGDGALAAEDAHQHHVARRPG